MRRSARRRPRRELAPNNSLAPAAGLAQTGRCDQEHSDELVELQSRNTGQIKALIASEEVKVERISCDFSPGPPATSRARPPVSTWRGCPRRCGAADRGRRPGYAVELPADDGAVEDRSGDCGRQHRGPQAQRHHAGVDSEAGRDRGRDPAAGCVQCDQRRWSDRQDSGRAPGAGAGVDHRFDPGRHLGRRVRRAATEAGAPGTGR